MFVCRKVYEDFGGGGYSTEAFVRFWEMYRDRLTTENARPLLYRMTRNMCVDRVRERPKALWMWK
ncbi:MAG: hypothetical protein ACLU4J_14070 [Butyricimonas paravirosa]